MKVLVCGSREFTNYELLEKTLDGFGEGKINQIIHGMARGADKIGGEYARIRGIEVLEFPANWGLYGNRAGPIRNAEMLAEGLPDCVVAFWDGTSRGTKNMIEQAQTAGIPTYVVNI